MKKTILLFLISGAFTFNSGFKSFRPGKDLALFFAVNDYDHWNDLANPVPDVEAIAKDLKDLYGFESEIVRNPDRNTILAKIEEYRKKTYDKDAQLMIFFSGHGEFNEATKLGYFIPKGGLKNDFNGDSYIEYEGLKRRISSLPCEHILLALDACYSGTADENIAMKGEPGKRPGVNAEAEREEYIAASLQYKTRLMLTSGAKVRTPDKSQFVAKFLEALRSQGGEDRLVNSSELLGYLTTASPKPVVSTFGEHVPGGEFLFIRSFNTAKEEGTSKNEQDLADWRAAKAANTIPAYQKYLDDYPTGEFREQASSAIRVIESDIAAKRRDDLAWDIAVEKNTMEGYKKYQAGYPRGLHSSEAIIKIKAMESIPSTPDDEMKFVKGGTFTMGCHKEQKDCDDDEKPAHQVKVGDFYIARCEVTQKQWKQVMGTNPSYNKNCEDCPVEQVSWNDVEKFLKKLNAQTGRNYRLPTEAEWEYAARNGSDKQYSVSNNLENTAWYYDNSSLKTHPVGKMQPNELGLFDMIGNVYEWCSDWYGAEYPSTLQTNPLGPSFSSTRVCRGGSWGDGAYSCRVSNRGNNAPDTRDEHIGFRLAQSVEH